MKDYLTNLKNEEGNAILTESQIKGILAENGKIVENEKNKVTESSKTEIQNYKDQIASLQEQIKAMPSNDEVENLKKQIDDFQKQENQRIADEKAKEEERIQNERIDSFFNEIKFASSSAKKGVIDEFKKMDFKYDETNKKFIGGNEWLEDMKKNDSGSFLSEVANPRFTTDVTPITNGMNEAGQKIGLNSKFKQ